jgi:parallel beta-helix repeat protein
MTGSDYQISQKLGFFSVKLSGKNKKFCLLLTALTLSLSGSFALSSQPILAQEIIAQSLNFDKNVVYVNPKIGNDSQSGKLSSPLKTITQALKIAKSGSTIQLTAGTYSEDTGETFPLILNNQITLQGNAKTQGNKIIIEGNGYFLSPTGAGQNIAIAALQDAGEITGITVINENPRGHGLWIESSSPKVVGNTFTRNGNTGVSINGNSSPLIEDNYFYNNLGNGLLIYGTSKPEVVDNSFIQTGFGVSIVQDATPTLTGNFFNSNRIAVILEGDSQGKFRDNEIINSYEYGLTAIAQSQVDLGTTAEPGNNIFRSNRELDIQNASDYQIVAVGTKTTGQTEGDISFEGGEFMATNNTNNTTEDLPPLPTRRNLDTSDNPPLPPLGSLPAPNPPESTSNSLPPLPATPEATTTDLPSPPPVTKADTDDADTANKELVFTAASDSPPASDSLSTPETEPVPFPPEISSLGDVLGGSTATEIKYKVLVEASDQDAETEVRSLYPQAFATVYQGKSVLQVGAFNNWDKAKQTQRSLDDLGLDTHLLQ